jgi:Uma2 family endonuclease
MTATIPLPIAPPPRGEDLPYDDGEPLESERHLHQMTLLIQSLKDAWSHRDDFFVGGNMFVYYSEAQARKNDFRGPDVFVVLDVEKKERRSWVVWEENGRLPDVVVEIVSETSEQRDREDKMRLYERVLRIPEYFLFDPFTAQLDGFVLDAARGKYKRLEPDARGWLWSQRLGLWVGAVRSRYQDIETQWLRWIDADGNVLRHPQERAEQEKHRAEQEKQRAEQEKHRAEQEKHRAEQEKHRADREKQRAEQEKQRAEQLASMLAEYERRFGPLVK